MNQGFCLTTRQIPLLSYCWFSCPPEVTFHTRCSALPVGHRGGTSWKELPELDLDGATPPVAPEEEGAAVGFCLSSALVLCACFVGTEGGGCSGTVSYLASDSMSICLRTVGYGTILKLGQLGWS